MVGVLSVAGSLTRIRPVNLLTAPQSFHDVSSHTRSDGLSWGRAAMNALVRLRVVMDSGVCVNRRRVDDVKSTSKVTSLTAKEPGARGGRWGGAGGGGNEGGSEGGGEDGGGEGGSGEGGGKGGGAEGGGSDGGGSEGGSQGGGGEGGG